MSNKTKKYEPLVWLENLRGSIDSFEVKRANVEKMSIHKQMEELAVELAFAEAMKFYRLKDGNQVTKAQFGNVQMLAYTYAIAIVTFANWRSFKQAYVFSKAFYEMLSEMDDFEIEWSLFERLPYPTMHLEILDDEDIAGITITYDAIHPEIGYVILFKDGETFNGGLIDCRKSNSFKDFFDNEVKLSNANPNSELVRLVRKGTAFVIQALMYLSAENADIRENEQHKKIYRTTNASSSKKEHFANVRRWDVGETVVAKYKLVKEQLAEETRKGEAIGRQRPRMHYRKAHWHRYWVGPGRKVCVLRFVSATVVNDNGDEIPVFKHHEE